MSEFEEEFTIEQYEEGEIVLKVLEKSILTKGAWATVIYLYQEMDKKTKEFKAPAARIVRYRKSKGQYRIHSKFNVSSAKQALEIASILKKWFKE